MEEALKGKRDSSFTMDSILNLTASEGLISYTVADIPAYQKS